MLICGQSWISVTIWVAIFSSLWSGSGNALAVTNNSLICLANKMTANNKPTWTATVRLTKTVNKKVAAKTRESAVFIFRRSMNVCLSLIFQATIISTGAILASGITEA